MKKFFPLLLVFIFVFHTGGLNGIITLTKNLILLLGFIISCINEMCVTMHGNTILSELFSHLITFRLVGNCLTTVALTISSSILLKYIGKFLYKILNNIISNILDNIYKLI